jgi:hypothetical protein
LDCYSGKEQAQTLLIRRISSGVPVMMEDFNHTGSRSISRLIGTDLTNFLEARFWTTSETLDNGWERYRPLSCTKLDGRKGVSGRIALLLGCCQIASARFEEDLIWKRALGCFRQLSGWRGVGT